MPAADPALDGRPRLADQRDSGSGNDSIGHVPEGGDTAPGSDEYKAALRELESLVDVIFEASTAGDSTGVENAFAAASAEARMMYWLNWVTVVMELQADSPEAIQEQVSHLMNGGEATLGELSADIESMSVEGQEHALFLLTNHPAAGVRQIGGVIAAAVGTTGTDSPAKSSQAAPSKASADDDLPPTVLAPAGASTSGPPPASDAPPTPSSRELAALRKNILGALDADSRLVELGQMAQSFMGDEASQFSLDEKGAVLFISMLDIYFSYAQDRDLYQTALRRVNVFVDRETKKGGRAWWLVRARLLEIGQQRGWSSLDTLYEDWTPGQRKQFNNMIAQETRQQGKTGGCYVATAVYGSYDCPEVRVLRRWRDNRLATTVPGREFIRLYYRVSPTVVRAFGNERWFSRAVRRPLDRFVDRLRASGYSSLPYSDDESSSRGGPYEVRTPFATRVVAGGR